MQFFFFSYIIQGTVHIDHELLPPRCRCRYSIANLSYLCYILSHTTVAASHCARLDLCMPQVYMTRIKLCYHHLRTHKAAYSRLISPPQLHTSFARSQFVVEPADWSTPQYCTNCSRAYDGHPAIHLCKLYFVTATLLSTKSTSVADISLHNCAPLHRLYSPPTQYQLHKFVVDWKLNLSPRGIGIGATL